MWEAWRLAKAYRTRPSDLYGVTDELAAWCFNRAVWHFGSALESELQAAVDKAKNENQASFRQQQVLSDWGIGELKFRDPAAGSAVKPAPREGSPAARPSQEDVSSETQGPVKL